MNKTNIDTIREALERADRFCDTHTAEQCPDTLALPIKEALAALSTMTDEQKLAEKYRLIALMNFETALANRELELGGWISDHAYSIQLLDCQIAELDTDKEEPTP